MGNRPSIGIIGAGKVGTVLALLLYRAGYAVTAVCSRRIERAGRLATQVEARICESPDDVFSAVALTLITVPDDQIELVASFTSGMPLQGRGIVHTSGAMSSRVLVPLEGQGAMVGSIHPAFPFASATVPASGLSEIVFAVETRHPVLRGWLLDLVTALDGQGLVLEEDQKALYHSAMVFTSNFSVTLFAISVRLLTMMGADRNMATAALMALLKGTISNLQTHGIPDALTGPFVRGDAGTVAANLDSLSRIEPALTSLYIRLARETGALFGSRMAHSDAIEQVLRHYEDRPADD